MNYLRLFAIAACLMLTTCTGSRQDTATNGTTADHKRRRIALVPKGDSHSFWQSVHAGAAKAAYELDADLMWQGPLKEDDQKMQVETVNGFVKQHVDALILAPLDAQALVPPVQAAVRQKIPVVIIDSDLRSSVHHAFIATDNRLGGRISAKRLCEQLGGRGKVALLRYAKGSASTNAREAGFLEGLREYGPRVVLVSDRLYAGVTVEQATKAATSLLTKHPDLNGVFTPTETSTQGTLQALRTRGKAGRVKFVGFDSNSLLLNALQKGEIHGLAVQDPFAMGYESVKTAIAILNKQGYEKRLDTGVFMVTKDNLNDPAIRELLNPDLTKWLRE
ncbi:MAG: substrate-binding domain-containing protein [Cytophagales bacterium]|jgi:ribose transport system substrate-binding protein|nr:substrate-binding domain-containing protein [Cytophagales bacterium]